MCELGCDENVDVTIMCFITLLFPQMALSVESGYPTTTTSANSVNTNTTMHGRPSSSHVPHRHSDLLHLYDGAADCMTVASLHLGGGVMMTHGPPTTTSSGQLPSCLYHRRALPDCKELAYEYDGDQNGVLRYIGTLYSTQDWVNPALTKRVQVC
jgi:hypothetical protein